MGRAALRWSRDRLAAQANLTPETIRNFEAGGALHVNHIAAIVAVLERSGIELLKHDGAILVCSPQASAPIGEDRFRPNRR
jgi:transcriptional regulator with XRE-family HTH domain